MFSPGRPVSGTWLYSDHCHGHSVPRIPTWILGLACQFLQKSKRWFTYRLFESIGQFGKYCYLNSHIPKDFVVFGAIINKIVFLDSLLVSKVQKYISFIY